MVEVSGGSDHLRTWLSRFLPVGKDKMQPTSGVATPDIAISTDATRVAMAEPEITTNKVTRPAPAASKNSAYNSITHQLSQSPTDIELDTLQWGQRINGPLDSTAQTSGELESSPSSVAASPRPADSHQHLTTILPSVSYPYINRWRLLACCVAFFVQGLNDSAPGAMLPYIERYYGVSHTMISLVFVANAVGFIAAAPFCHLLNNRFGRSKVLSACTVLNSVAYTALACQPPFAVVVVAFLFLGYGFATILALDNVFVINLSGGTVLLGYMHGCYGIGGIVSPFVATAMVSSGIRWSIFYTIPLAISLVNMVAFFYTFRGYETDTASAQLVTALERTISRQTSIVEKKSILRKALKNRTTILGALLIFAYQGAEVSISGWVISFLINYRNGNPAQVGYVTSGFWGGITLGRFILVTPAHKIGDKISVFFLVLGTAAFQFMVWFLPNVIGNAVAVALIGFLLGPIYPVATGVFSRLLPGSLHLSSLGFISSMGSSGGAVLPFVVGALSQQLSTVVLNPICIALCVVMNAAWLGLPKATKRSE